MFVVLCWAACLSPVCAADEVVFSQLESLPLDASQTAQIESISQTYHNDTKRIETDLQHLEGRLDSLLNVGSYTDSQIASIRTQIQSLQQQLSDMKVQVNVEVKKILTDEQRRQLHGNRF